MDGKTLISKGLMTLVLILAFSCEKIREKPDNLINQDKMADILVDYFLYKETPSIYNYGDYRANYEETNIAVAQKHEVRFTDFEQSWEYYILQEPKVYAKILETVETRLTDSVPDLDIDVSADRGIKRIEVEGDQKPKKGTKESKTGKIISLDSIRNKKKMEAVKQSNTGIVGAGKSGATAAAESNTRPKPIGASGKKSQPTSKDKAQYKIKK